jgi:hypothetical protein
VNKKRPAIKPIGAKGGTKQQGGNFFYEMRLVFLDGRWSDFGKLFFQAVITDTVTDRMFDTGKSPIISLL